MIINSNHKFMYYFVKELGLTSSPRFCLISSERTLQLSSEMEDHARYSYT